MYALTQGLRLSFAKLFCLPRNWRSGAGFCLLVITVPSLFVACDPFTQQETMWSQHVRSPNGAWLAEARAIDVSGPGDAAFFTEVHLLQSNTSERPETVLWLGYGPGMDMCPQLKWMSDSQLEVIFRTKPELYTQVIKYHGINIVVKVVPSGGPKSDERQPKGIGNACDIK